MKIGIDCRLWDETGVGRYIRNLVLNLQKLDKQNNYTLFTLSKNREKILNSSKRTFLLRGGTAQNDNFKVVEANIRWHSVEEQIKFPQILNRENLDLVHFPYPSMPIFYNRPFVVTVHDLIRYHYPTGKASTLPVPVYNLKLLGYKFVIKQAAKKARKIITVSNTTKKEIIDHLGINSEKIVVTYEGIDSAMLNSKVKNQNSKFQVKSKKYFLYVGNAYPHKNLERVIDAFEILLRQLADQNDIRLVLVGKEDYFYKRLKEKVQKMKLSNKVIFLENVTDEELFCLYKNALALILPSLMEGFGLPALEAMANKCLVLASNIPALKEICADAAIYFDPYNVKDIEQKMDVIYSNDINHYSGNVEKGLRRVKLFSWRKMAQETLQVYEDSVGL